MKALENQANLTVFPSNSNVPINPTHIVGVKTPPTGTICFPTYQSVATARSSCVFDVNDVTDSFTPVRHGVPTTMSGVVLSPRLYEAHRAVRHTQSFVDKPSSSSQQPLPEYRTPGHEHCISDLVTARTDSLIRRTPSRFAIDCLGSVRGLHPQLTNEQNTRQCTCERPFAQQSPELPHRFRRHCLTLHSHRWDHS